MSGQNGQTVVNGQSAMSGQNEQTVVNGQSGMSVPTNMTIVPYQSQPQSVVSDSSDMMNGSPQMGGGGGRGFFDHMTHFDVKSKVIALNTIQDALIAVSPVVVWNKIMQRFVPPADSSKGSMEISLEVVGQIVAMFCGIILIHRFIVYFPTYSGVGYGTFNVTNVVLAVLMIVLSLKTKVGEKVAILADRVVDVWEGTDSVGQSKKREREGLVSSSSSLPLPPALHTNNNNNESSGGGMEDYMSSNKQQDYYSKMPIDYSSSSSVHTIPEKEYEPMAANEMGVKF